MEVDQFIVPHRMNQDVDERALKQDECRRKLNVRTGTTEGSNAYSGENFKGTLPVVNPYYDAGDKEIGNVEDISNNSIIYFFYNVTKAKNKIIRYFPNLEGKEAVELILRHEYLNFKEDHHITDADVIDGVLYWTDGYEGTPFVDYNPPRQLHLERAAKYTRRVATAWGYQIIGVATNLGYPGMTAYFGTSNPSLRVGQHVVCFTDDGDWEGVREKTTTGYCTVLSIVASGGYYRVITDRPWTASGVSMAKSGNILVYEPEMYFGIDYQVLDVIKWPPWTAPSASYTDDPDSTVNLLRDQLYQFAYRWVNFKKEKSVFSPFSAVPIPSKAELLNGAYDNLTPKDNVINVWMDTGPMEIESIELIVRRGNKGPWGLLKRIFKYDQDGNCLVTSDINILYEFRNNELIEPMDNEVTSNEFRPFDFVPQIASRQEVIEKNRLAYAKFKEGFDNHKIDIQLKHIPQYVNPVNISGISQVRTIRELWMFDGEDEMTANADFYWAGQLNFDLPGVSFEPGYFYYINIDARPLKYEDDPNDYSDWGYIPAPFVNTFIGGTAVVYAQPGMTWAQFRDAVIGQLRFLNRDSTVLATVEKLRDPDSDFLGFDGYDHGRIVGGGAVPLHGIYFVIEAKARDDYTPCSHCGMVNVSITKASSNLRYTTFKSGATHPLCVFYKDRGGRISTALTSDASRLYIPYETEKVSPNTICRNKIEWKIYNRPAMEAVEWCLGYAGNSSQEYFLQAAVAGFGDAYHYDCKYIEINSYIENNISSIKRFNIKPYEWQRGDRLRVLFYLISGNWYAYPHNVDVEIIGQYHSTDAGDIYKYDETGDPILDKDGNKVADVAKLRFLIQRSPDLDEFLIVPGKCVVEIYRPKKEIDEKPYYQFGPWLKVLNPHTANRLHAGTTNNQTPTTPATGILDYGDAYVMARFMGAAFPCESMWYSDFYDSTDISIGQPNIENRDMERREYTSYLRFSQILIENTRVNGLSSFYAKDLVRLSQKYGAIYGMKENGDVLRVLQERKATSCYVGQVSLKQANDQPDIMALSDSVIGGMRIHPNDNGTIFPGSMVNSGDYTYFFDIYRGKVYRWASNGIEPIVGKDNRTGWDFGMETYFRNKSRALLLSGVENVRIFATFEEEFGNLVLTFVDLLHPENSETVMFHEPSNSWTTYTSFLVDGYGSCGQVMTSTLGGVIYRHNVNPIHNFFHGVQYPSEIEVAGTPQVPKIVVFKALEVHSTHTWESPETGDITVITDGTPMRSRLKAARFTRREGISVAAYGRDMFTHGKESINDLSNGRELRGYTLRQKLVNNDTEEVVIFGVNIKGLISE